MRDASDPGFAALDATIANALQKELGFDLFADPEWARTSRAVRDALLAEGEIWFDYPPGPGKHRTFIYELGPAPLGVGVAPDQHNTPHA